MIQGIFPENSKSDELTFLQTWLKSDDILILEEILNFQNIKSDFLHLIRFSQKLTSNLANFRKFKCCRERNLDLFKFLQFWYFTYKPFLEKVIRFLERRNYSVFMMYHWFHAIINFFNRKYGPNITNFEIFWNFYFNFHKKFKIGDIGSTFSVRNLQNDMKLSKKSQKQNSFFFLKM